MTKWHYTDNRSVCKPLIYGLSYHNFNLKYERVCCILNKIYIQIIIFTYTTYIIYNIYTYICLKCTQFLKINAGNSLSVHIYTVSILLAPLSKIMCEQQNENLMIGTFFVIQWYHRRHNCKETFRIPDKWLTITTYPIWYHRWFWELLQLKQF